MDINPDIAHRLFKIRRFLNLNQVDMADKIFIERSSISSFENCKRGISKRAIDGLETYLNVNINYLLNGEGEMFKPKDYNEVSDIVPKSNESMPPSYSNESIEQLIEQNNELVKQVSDLIKMQLLNAESIRNLSTQHVRHQDRKGNTG